MQTQTYTPDLSPFFAEGLLCEGNPPKPVDPPDHNGGNVTTPGTTSSNPPPEPEPSDAEGKPDE